MEVLQRFGQYLTFRLSYATIDTAQYLTQRERHMTPVDTLRSLFAKAEAALEKDGRDVAKTHLPEIYKLFMSLNKWDNANWVSMFWKPEGDLTEAEFNELNLRRKKLSNAIGIKTADGTIRHDLNEI